MNEDSLTFLSLFLALPGGAQSFKAVERLFLFNLFNLFVF